MTCFGVQFGIVDGHAHDSNATTRTVHPHRFFYALASAHGPILVSPLGSYAEDELSDGSGGFHGAPKMRAVQDQLGFGRSGSAAGGIHTGEGKRHRSTSSSGKSCQGRQVATPKAKSQRVYEDDELSDSGVREDSCD